MRRLVPIFREWAPHLLNYCGKGSVNYLAYYADFQHLIGTEEYLTELRNGRYYCPQTDRVLVAGAPGFERVFGILYLAECYIDEEVITMAVANGAIRPAELP